MRYFYCLLLLLVLERFEKMVDREHLQSGKNDKIMHTLYV